MRAAHRTDQFPFGCDVQRRFQIMSVRTAVRSESGKHQPQAVEQLGARAEGGADTGDSRPLPQRERGGHVQHLVDLRLCGLRHPPPRVGGKRVEIPPGAFGVQYAQRKRGLAGAGHAGDADNPVQRNLHIDVLQIMYPCTAHDDTGRRCRSIFHKYPSFLRMLPLYRRAPGIASPLT